MPSMQKCVQDMRYLERGRALCAQRPLDADAGAKRNKVKNNDAANHALWVI